MVRMKNKGPDIRSTYYLKTGQTLQNTNVSCRFYNQKNDFFPHLLNKIDQLKILIFKPSERSLALVVPNSELERFKGYA